MPSHRFHNESFADEVPYTQSKSLRKILNKQGRLSSPSKGHAKNKTRLKNYFSKVRIDSQQMKENRSVHYLKVLIKYIMLHSIDDGITKKRFQGIS